MWYCNAKAWSRGKHLCCNASSHHICSSFVQKTDTNAQIRVQHILKVLILTHIDVHAQSPYSVWSLWLFCWLLLLFRLITVVMASNFRVFFLSPLLVVVVVFSFLLIYFRHALNNYYLQICLLFIFLFSLEKTAKSTEPNINFEKKERKRQQT